MLTREHTGKPWNIPVNRGWEECFLQLTPNIGQNTPTLSPPSPCVLPYQQRAFKSVVGEAFVLAALSAPMAFLSAAAVSSLPGGAPVAVAALRGARVATVVVPLVLHLANKNGRDGAEEPVDSAVSRAVNDVNNVSSHAESVSAQVDATETSIADGRAGQQKGLEPRRNSDVERPVRNGVISSRELEQKRIMGR